MSESDDYRLELGKRADKCGRILAQVGEQYELREAGSQPNAPAEFVTGDLAEIDRFLTRLESPH